MPFKFGGWSVFSSDKKCDLSIIEDYGLINWLNSSLSNSLPEHPKSLNELLSQLYNHLFFHQFIGKWDMVKVYLYIS